MSVAILGPERVAETARLLAAAMHDDAGYRFLIPDPARRPDGLAEFFRGRLAMHLPHRCSYVRAGAAGRVASTVTLRPPGGVAAPIALLVRALVPYALHQGVGVLRRLLYMSRSYERLEHAASGGGPYWHVHMMAVRPELQGRGLGSALLDDALAAAKAEPAPIVLTTHTEANVRFYARAGFRVAADETLRPPGGEPYRVWSMRRDPA